MIDCRVAVFTVRFADPVTVLNGDTGFDVVALIVVLPGACAVAKPWVPSLLLTVAAVVDELHTTSWVKSRDVPSLNWPIATNCCVIRTGMLGGMLGLFGAETEMEMSVT